MNFDYFFLRRNLCILFDTPGDSLHVDVAIASPLCQKSNLRLDSGSLHGVDGWTIFLLLQPTKLWIIFPTLLRITVVTSLVFTRLAEYRHLNLIFLLAY